MSKIRILVAALAMLGVPASVGAELPVGAYAPKFVARGALGGRDFTFNLRRALQRGPVVLYFYPKAFTKGCTMEARAFAEASKHFAAAGATVVGMSADDLPTLKRFSTEECRNKFAVAIASPQTIRGYDVALTMAGISTGMTDRVSYVIGQDGRVAFVHSDLDYRDHVRLTLDAVRKLRAKKR